MDTSSLDRWIMTDLTIQLTAIIIRDTQHMLVFWYSRLLTLYRCRAPQSFSLGSFGFVFLHCFLVVCISGRLKNVVLYFERVLSWRQQNIPTPIIPRAAVLFVHGLFALLFTSYFVLFTPYFFSSQHDILSM